jgi:hypothetical protein
VAALNDPCAPGFLTIELVLPAADPEVKGSGNPAADSKKI